MVHGQPGELLHGLDQQLGAAEGVGGVDLVLPVLGDVYVGVARQGSQARLPVVRLVQQHDGVGTRPLGLVLNGAPTCIRSHDEPGLAGSVCRPGQGIDAGELGGDVVPQPGDPRCDESQGDNDDDDRPAHDPAPPGTGALRPLRPLGRE